MRKIFLFLVMFLFGIPAMEAQKGGSELFNGKNLSGWETVKSSGKAKFKVVNSSIQATYNNETANTYLATKNGYTDFVFECEFFVEDGLYAGVLIRGHLSSDNKSVSGYSIVIDPSERAWSGGINEESGRGWLYDLSQNAEARDAFNKNNWNKLRIEAVGNSIRTWINDMPAADIIDNQTEEGFIALQINGSGNKKELEGKNVMWRNIKIITGDVDNFKTPYSALIPQNNLICNTISEREAAEGWKLLWDGKTTNGWRSAKGTAFPEKGWYIENGLLRVEDSGGGESAHGGDIVTINKYRNFELLVDFCFTKGANSGIKYFVDTELNLGEGSSIGCEFQILDNENHPDAKLGVNGNRTLGSLYDLIPASPIQSIVPGGWHTAKVLVEGNHVEHWLDGKKIVEYERNNQMWNALVAYSKYSVWPNFGNYETGYILLQDHGDAVDFRNIKIREIK